MELWEQYDQMCLTGSGTEEQRAALAEKLKCAAEDTRKFPDDAAGQEMDLIRRLSEGEMVNLLSESERLRQVSAPTAQLWKWAAFLNGTPSEDALQQLEQELEGAGQNPLNELMRRACREQREAVRSARQRRSDELDDEVDNAQKAADKAAADRQEFERNRRYW